MSPRSPDLRKRGECLKNTRFQDLFPKPLGVPAFCLPFSGDTRRSLPGLEAVALSKEDFSKSWQTHKISINISASVIKIP
jgi:hypothetical protein